jgi:rhodanese-related sulfurtransferase
MKKYISKEIIGSITIAIVLIIFSINISKCHGSGCKVENVATVVESQIFPKMIPEVIEKQVANNEIVLLDVRENSEWDAGHIAGAKHITLGNINSETTKELPKNMPIYAYCRSGKRAEEGTLKLQELGFSNAEDLGGIVYWQERGGELVK